MQTVILYMFKRADGGYSVSPNRPEGEYETRVRLIADEGKALTDGKVVTQCTDAESADGWTEIDAPGEDAPGENAPEAIAAVDEAIGIRRGEEQG